MTAERRNHDRLRAVGPVHYCCSDSEKQLPESLSSLSDLGIVVNFSESGLCFIATYPLDVGQNIVVHSPRLSDGVEEGVVRWCMRTGANLWKIGIQRSPLGNLAF